MKKIIIALFLTICAPLPLFSMENKQTATWSPGDIISNPGKYVQNGRTEESLDGLKVGDLVGVVSQTFMIAALVRSIQHPPEWNPDLGMSLVLQRSPDDNDMIPALASETVNLKYLTSQAN